MGWEWMGGLALLQVDHSNIIKCYDSWIEHGLSPPVFFMILVYVGPRVRPERWGEVGRARNGTHARTRASSQTPHAYASVPPHSEWGRASGTRGNIPQIHSRGRRWGNGVGGSESGRWGEGGRRVLRQPGAVYPRRSQRVLRLSPHPFPLSPLPCQRFKPPRIRQPPAFGS